MFNAPRLLRFAIINLILLLASIPSVLAGPLFETRMEIPAGADPHSVAVHDLDGDGLLDLAVANRESDDVSIILGNGDLLTPYGRLNIRHESISVELASGVPLIADITESHMAIGFNGGVAWQEESVEFFRLV